MTTPARILILSGAGRYSDPWHPYVETSGALGDILRELPDTDVRISEDADAALTNLSGVDLLVVNTGNPAENGEAAGSVDDAQRAAVSAAVRSFRSAGGSLLVTHSGTSSLPEYPEIVELMPARWTPESWHPEFGEVDLPVSPGHPITDGLKRIAADDELYSGLVVDPDAEVLLAHELDGTRHPLILATEHDGTRVVVDALGHDARSYLSASHRHLLQQAGEWLLRRR
ncbi:ThuA domain-containing protein [Herbiconiux sp. SYSU D00978]|uniref:ThuA domain-containing protein n=1 Tax=Herbiconiux sp. SYSU D00978 TaxID=2812562 RepID=UPI001A9796E8|nr:ThuA domain-containing protein [Herbiconiux sp. SYSU D00978]